MQLAGRVARLHASLVREILALASRPDVISFAGGLPAADAMPPLDFGALPQSLGQYGATEGEMVLRAAVADRLRGEGLDVDANQVLITAGSQQGIDLVSKLFIDEEASVAVESPTYLAALQSFTLFGARYHGMALDSEGLVPGAVTASAADDGPRFAYLIPDFQNPSSCCYTRGRREAAARELGETGIPLVEDAPYRDLVYDAVDRAPIASLLPPEHPWVYLGSFSKVAVPGLRIGFLACSPPLFPLLTRLKQAGDLHTARPPQHWLAAFMAPERYDSHLEALREFYRARRDAMDAALRRHLGGAAAWTVPAGGLFFWVRLLEPGIDTYDLLSPALERKVAFMPGRPFFAEGGDSCWMRLNFSHATPERIDEGIVRLADLIGGGAARAAAGA